MIRNMTTLFQFCFQPIVNSMAYHVSVVKQSKAFSMFFLLQNDACLNEVSHDKNGWSP